MEGRGQVCLRMNTYTSPSFASENVAYTFQSQIVLAAMDLKKNIYFRYVQKKLLAGSLAIEMQHVWHIYAAALELMHVLLKCYNDELEGS